MASARRKTAGAEELTIVSLRLYREDILKIKNMASRVLPYQAWIREKVHEAVLREGARAVMR